MRSEVQAAVAHAESVEVQHNLAIIAAMKATYTKTGGFPGFGPKAWPDWDSPRSKAIAAMVRTFAKGAEVERRERLGHVDETETDPVDPTGGGDNIVELPTDATARAIIRAGAKRRGENV
jgi:hypothetical protein